MLPCATVLAVPPDAATYRASGLVLWHKAADVIENSSGSLLELKQPLTRMSLLRARPDEFRGSFLPLKINAGGNRARARQSRVVEICLDTLTNLTRSP